LLSKASSISQCRAKNVPQRGAITNTTSSTTHNSVGSTTTTTTTTTQTTTVSIDANGNYVDSQGNQTSSTTQTTTVASKTETKTASGFIAREGSSTNTSTSSVKPETNKLGNAISGWLKDGHSGTPFLTVGQALSATLTVIGYVNLPARWAKALSVLGAGMFVGSNNSGKYGSIISSLANINDRKIEDIYLQSSGYIDRIPGFESLSAYYGK
jgi:hypothetical protein